MDTFLVCEWRFYLVEMLQVADREHCCSLNLNYIHTCNYKQSTNHTMRQSLEEVMGIKKTLSENRKPSLTSIVQLKYKNKKLIRAQIRE